MSNIVKGSGIIYTTGVPNTIPNQGTDAEFAIDINGNQYAWNRTNTVWDNVGQGIEIATSSLAPTHTPSNFRPRFLMTPSRELYFYSGSWGTVGSLPSGLISSSTQIGPTGIYSGSGVVPPMTMAKVNYSSDAGQTGSLLFSEYSDYDILKGYDIRRFGLSHNMTGSAYGFGGFVSTSGSAFQILSSVSQSITQECKFEVSPQKITFYSESGSNNRGTIEFNSNDGLKYLTVPPPLTKYSFVHKDYVDTAINSRPLTIPALSGSKGNFESTVSFSTSNKRILVYGITLTELIVNVQPESYLDGTDFELIFIASVVNTLTIQFDLGSITVPISNITGFHTVKYIFTYFQPSNIWIITDYVAIA